jgi:hypothetical protein
MDCWISKKYHDYSTLLSARAPWQMSTGSGRVSTPAAASLAAAAASLASVRR